MFALTKMANLNFEISNKNISNFRQWTENFEQKNKAILQGCHSLSLTARS